MHEDDAERAFQASFDAPAVLFDFGIKSLFWAHGSNWFIRYVARKEGLYNSESVWLSKPKRR